jgi:peptidoglycan hydrolase-like protein with peptidoglycan-binding domain
MLPPIGAGAPSEVQPSLLKNGSEGPEVQQLQKQLNEWRVRNGKEPISEDGIFGNKTEAAVRDFQAANGLSVDGIAGPNTRDRVELESNENFQQLPSATQDQVRNMMSEFETRPTPNKQAPPPRPPREPLEEPIGAPGTPVDKQIAKDNLIAVSTDPNKIFY